MSGIRRRQRAELTLSRFRRTVTGARTPLGRRALRHGVLPTGTPQPMLRRLCPSFVVDVGANRGQFSLDVALASPNTRVLALEPIASEAAVYRSIFESDQRFELRETAVGADSQQVTLHVCRARDSSSFLSPTELQVKMFPGTEEMSTVAMMMSTLDSVLCEEDIDRRALLKADVQGFELEVLRGGETVLGRFQWVYLEVSFLEFYAGQPLADEVISYLQARRFRLVEVGTPVRVDGRAVQVDVLFERTGDDPPPERCRR